MEPVEPGAVKLFCGILYSDRVVLQKGIELMIETYGSIDSQSTEFPFDQTDYYLQEMGGPIVRFFISFEKLIHPKSLAQIKIKTNAIEEKIAVKGNRCVNLDPGYMDYDKVVLASAKYNGQKIYLDHGIWADLTLHFKRGHFEPYPWSFPDFKRGLYNNAFLKIRQIYKAQRKN